MKYQVYPSKEIITKNKVASLIIYACPANNGQLTGGRFKNKEIIYDNFGNEVEYIEYKRGKNDKWEKYKYDKEQRLIEKTWYQCIGYDKSKYRFFVDKFSYDNDGKLITPYSPIVELDKDNNNIETTFYLNGKIRGRRYFYNNGICKEEHEYKSNVIVGNKKYDEKGNLIIDEKFDTKGNPTNYTSYEYDSKGNKTRIKKVSRTGYISQDRTLTYDANNNLIEDRDIEKTAYQIHANTNIESLEKEHSESYRHNYYYDAKQLLIQDKMYLVNELIMIYNYEYKYRLR